MRPRGPVAAELDAFDLFRRLHPAQRLDQHLRVDRCLAGDLGQARSAVAPVRHESVVVGADPLRLRAYFGERHSQTLHRVLRARVFEVHVEPVDARDRLRVLLLDRGHDQGRVGVGTEHERDGPLRGYVMKAGQIADTRGIEDAHRVEVHRVHAGHHRLTSRAIFLIGYVRHSPPRVRGRR